MSPAEYDRTPAEVWAQVDSTEYGGDPLVIACALYDAALNDGGSFSVKRIAKDWKIPEDVLLTVIRVGWSLGRWGDRRSYRERRGAVRSPFERHAHINLSEMFPRLAGKA